MRRNRSLQGRRFFPTFTSLNAPQREILMQIKQDPNVRWPLKLRSPLEKGDQSKYCDFHEDHEHTTDICFELKRQIEYLLQYGKLLQFILEHGMPYRDRLSSREWERTPH